MYNHIKFSLFKFIAVRIINLTRYLQQTTLYPQSSVHSILVRDLYTNYKFYSRSLHSNYESYMCGPRVADSCLIPMCRSVFVLLCLQFQDFLPTSIIIYSLNEQSFQFYIFRISIILLNNFINTSL